MSAPSRYDDHHHVNPIIFHKHVQVANKITISVALSKYQIIAAASMSPTTKAAHQIPIICRRHAAPRAAPIIPAKAA